MRSRCDRLLDLAGMCERRERDDQQIDLRIQHATQIGERLRAEARSELPNLALAPPAAGDELHFVLQDADCGGVARADTAAAEQAHAQSLHTQAPNVSTDCSIPGSPASIRANSAGASANATVCVMSGNRFKRFSYWRRTAVCHSRRLAPAVTGGRTHAGDLRADQLDAVVMELLAQRQPARFALEEAHRDDAARIRDRANRFGERRQPHPKPRCRRRRRARRFRT